jgi:hypothetical protein
MQNVDIVVSDGEQDAVAAGDHLSNSFYELVIFWCDRAA